MGRQHIDSRARVRSFSLILAAAIALCLLPGAARASAAPLSMGFTEARANVGVQLSDAALFEAPDVAPFAAQIDPAGGAISNGVLGVPRFSTFITDPIEADVTVDFQIGTIEGSFDSATGALSLSGEAGGTLTSEGRQCAVSTEPVALTLTTAGSSGGANPRSGSPFTSGLDGSGAIAGEWTDMHAAPINGDVGFCENVEDRIGGAGGIWLEQKDVVAPQAPLLFRTDPAEGGLSGEPRILGAAEAGSTVRIYAGSTCAGAPAATASAGELNSPGIAVKAAESGTSSFSATATDAAGNTSACSAPISYTRLHADPPKPPIQPLEAPVCVVPRLVGKTLAQAKAALRSANCRVGIIFKPKYRKGAGRKHLVVRSSDPASGSSPADATVDLRLGPKPSVRR